MSKGMIECKVCHRDFALIAEDHYVARDPEPIGAIHTLTCKDPAHQYDAIDCPHCGCQNILQNRKPEVCPCEYGICDECEEEEEESDECEEEEEESDDE